MLRLSDLDATARPVRAQSVMAPTAPARRTLTLVSSGEAVPVEGHVDALGGVADADVTALVGAGFRTEGDDVLELPRGWQILDGELVDGAGRTRMVLDADGPGGVTPVPVRRFVVARLEGDVRDEACRPGASRIAVLDAGTPVVASPEFDEGDAEAAEAAVALLSRWVDLVGPELGGAEEWSVEGLPAPAFACVTFDVAPPREQMAVPRLATEDRQAWERVGFEFLHDEGDRHVVCLPEGWRSGTGDVVAVDWLGRPRVGRVVPPTGPGTVGFGLLPRHTVEIVGHGHAEGRRIGMGLDRVRVCQLDGGRIVTSPPPSRECGIRERAAIEIALGRMRKALARAMPDHADPTARWEDDV